MNLTDPEKRLVTQLRQLPASERDTALAEACRADTALVQRRDILSAALSEPRSVEEAVSLLESALEPLAEDTPGARIGPYKLLEKIGEGGFGSVWMAEQTAPVRRRVALKIIKLGMDTEEVIARFEAERQALALMSHPNIAQVFDAGSTDSGRPYFVMELVRGVAITRYCDDNALSAPARLQLVITVCQAVQHAHQRGVIHRDLKPSNILVTLHDGEPTPKIIDFGIAKATGAQLTERTLHTRFHFFMGTPAYTSPEQMEMSGLDVDTRSDVYSLGVLVYELLAGRPPFDPDTLARSGLEAMRRIIREIDPPLPSRRLDTLPETDRATVACRRGTDAARLTLMLRGDLDWIVMRCLEKDRTRRYETVSDLAWDIRRYLANEPVIARPPTPLYLLGKLIRRHRLTFVAGSTVALALMGGIVTSTIETKRATRAENTATRERMAAEHARDKAESHRRKAQTEATRSSQVAQFMKDMLKSVGPSVALGRDTVMLREILDATARRLDTELGDQPEVVADLRETLGQVYHDLGRYAEAEPLVRAVVEARRQFSGSLSAELATALTLHGELLVRINKLDAADAALQEALVIRRRIFGQDHPVVAETLFQMAWVLVRQSRMDEAEARLGEVLAMQRRAFGSEHRSIADTLTLLGICAVAKFQHERAITLHTEALALYRRLLPPMHPSIASSLDALGYSTAHVGRKAESIAAFGEEFDICRKVSGDQHPKTTVAFLRTFSQIRVAGASDDTVARARDFVASQRRLLPADSPLLAPSLLVLASFLEPTARNPSEAGRLREEADALLEKPRLGGPPLDGEIIDAMGLYGWWRFLDQEPGANRPMSEAAVKLAQGLYGPRKPRSRQSNHSLAWVYWGMHHNEAAVRQFEEAVSADLATVGPNHPFFGLNTAGLGAAYRESGRLTDSKQLLEKTLAAWELLSPSEKPPPATFALVKTELGLTLNRFGEFTRAEQLFREALRHYDLQPAAIVSRRIYPHGKIESALGQALLGQRRFEEAEPLFLHALQEMRANRDLIAGDAPRMLSEAHDAIVALYVAWNKPDKAAEWQVAAP